MAYPRAAVPLTLARRLPSSSPSTSVSEAAQKAFMVDAQTGPRYGHIGSNAPGIYAESITTSHPEVRPPSIRACNNARNWPDLLGSRHQTPSRWADGWSSQLTLISNGGDMVAADRRPIAFGRSLGHLRSRSAAPTGKTYIFADLQRSLVLLPGCNGATGRRCKRKRTNRR